MAIHIRFYTPKVIRIENACNQLRSAEYAVREVGEYACDGQLPVVDIEHLAHRRFFAEERFGELAADDDAVPGRQHVTGIALLQFDREHMEERRVDAVDRYLHIFLADT